MDANAAPAERWSDLSSELKKRDIHLPAKRDPGGLILPGKPRVGVWLMPDNASTGELEDFVRTLIPDSDPIWRRAQSYIDAIPIKDRKFKSRKLLRAQVHAWLAVRSRPRQMGQAIRDGDLDATGPLAKCFVNWLDRLYS